PEAVSEAQEFTLAALTHAQRMGMGRLIPDRYFWAREPAAPMSDEPDATDTDPLNNPPKI
ncbi:MAG TPA: hypothetical protein VNX00_11005, partial [Herbaspirillum sp.]|nr:hypothetical protein [Herbaspirillum sp.]